jgi:hypothetical protein
MLAPAYILSGQEEKAQLAAEKLLELYPKFSVVGYEKRSPIRKKEDLHRITEAMRKAGLPEPVSRRSDSTLLNAKSVIVLAKQYSRLPDKRDWNAFDIKDPNPYFDTSYQFNGNIPVSPFLF